MSYNLKNKSIVIIALALAGMMAISHSSFAEEPEVALDVPAEVQGESPEAAASEDILAFDTETDNLSNSEAVAENADENSVPENADELFGDDSTDELTEASDSPENSDSASPSSEDTVDETDNVFDNGEGVLQTSLNTDDMSMESTPDDALDADLEDIGEDQSSALPETEAPKSPFESFGNAILSKVDNDLFNQMSNIEKQNTLLNLELKREELKNKVEALRAARNRAKEEEAARHRAEEEKLKDQEAKRQAMILEEQAKLKEQEIELEKVRQGKVLNEYMNQMLIMNQEWIEKNAALQNQIRELKEERMELIKTFEEKMGQIQNISLSLKRKTELAVSNHDRLVNSLNSQIAQLKKSVTDSEEKIRKLQEPDSEANPFANASASGVDGSGIDMSHEYAIMDITGKGDDIVAKIVNKEGTTFSIHRGSMMKGGEVVTDITDHYVAFENNGIKSFIYTGGTVLEFEPTTAFNDSDKLPEEGNKSSGAKRNSVKNAYGSSKTQKTSSESKAPEPEPAVDPRTQASSKRRAASSSSFGSGMFVQ